MSQAETPRILFAENIRLTYAGQEEGPVYLHIDGVPVAEVALGRDDGYQVEVTGDVQPGDLVAMNLSQAARDNELVQPVQIPGT